MKLGNHSFVSGSKLGICQSYKELAKIRDLALDVLSPEEARKAIRISLKEQENAETEQKGEEFWMERRALIVWNLAKALLVSSSNAFVGYIWELVGDDEHLSVTFSRIALIRDILVRF